MFRKNNFISTSLEKRVFLNVLLISIASVLGFLINAIVILHDTNLIITNTIALVLLITMYLLSRFRDLYHYLVMPYAIIALAGINSAWFISGGYVSSTSYIMFAILIIGIIVTRNKYTLLIIVIISMNIVVLYSLEILYPELAVTFDKKKDIVSHGVVFLAVMVIINYLILQLKASYEYERKKTIEINDDLKRKNEEINHQNTIIQSQNLELKSYSEDLERKVNDRTELLSNMNKDLSAHNLTLEQFTFITAHNLRSPVAQIKGLIHLIGHDVRSGADADETLRQLNKSSANLEEVVHDITRILNIKKGGEKLESIRLKEQLDLTMAILDNEIAEKKAVISFSGRDDLCIDGIRAYVQSIFYNLIHNAIKYASKDRRPQIDISFSLEQGLVVIVCKDNGIGIEMDYASKKIFQLYQRFNTDYQGKGYGLFLTKTQVEAMRGDITVSSVLNKGTTFTVRFPLST